MHTIRLKMASSACTLHTCACKSKNIKNNVLHALYDVYCTLYTSIYWAANDTVAIKDLQLLWISVTHGTLDKCDRRKQTPDFASIHFCFAHLVSICVPMTRIIDNEGNVLFLFLSPSFLNALTSTIYMYSFVGCIIAWSVRDPKICAFQRWQKLVSCIVHISYIYSIIRISWWLAPSHCMRACVCSLNREFILTIRTCTHRALQILSR